MNSFYNYILYLMHNIIIIFLTKASWRNAIRKKYGSNWGCYCFLFETKTVKCSVHCHVLAQSPPGRRLNNKYPFNTSHRTDLCKNISLQYCLVATVIHVQSARSQICVYRVIHKSLRDFRTRLRNNQDRRGRKEHINR